MTCSRSGNRSTITTPPSPELQELGGPRRTPEASWSVRRDLYVGLLPEPDAFVLFAEVDSAAVGYGLVHMRGPRADLGDRRPSRGAGDAGGAPRPSRRRWGSALLEAVYAEPRGIGVGHLGVGGIASNSAAVRFYGRLGLLPFMVSYIGKVPSSSSPPTL